MDRDNTKGGLTGGPETITLKEHNGKYLVYVHQYTSSPAQDMCSARPKITIYPGKEKKSTLFFQDKFNFNLLLPCPQETILQYRPMRVQLSAITTGNYFKIAGLVLNV